MLLPLSECITRRLYRIHCRNLRFGVYNGKGGFIGIRRKFENRFLFTEYHWDYCTHYGTVNKIIDTEVDLPDNIELAIFLGRIDEKTRREVTFDKPKSEGGKGWYFCDTGEAGDITAVAVSNTALFEFLEEQGRRYNALQTKDV